jgi:tetratricopeptide (TPR) repeat protein
MPAGCRPSSRPRRAPAAASPISSRPRPLPESTVALKPFLEELEARLCALSAEQLHTLLVAHAERLPARERERFLDIFAAPLEGRAEPSGADEPFLAEIDAFGARLRSGAYLEGWGWDDDLHEERAFGDESWADEMNGLFRAAGDCFVAGNLELACEAYGRLLSLLADEEDGFCGPFSPEEMLETDVGEAKARYLRALYETAPPAERPKRLADVVSRLAWVGGNVTLRQIADTRRAELPDLEAFLPRWIERAGVDDRLGVELLIEAVELERGSAGLAALARERGVSQPEIYMALADALAGEGRLEDAAAACCEALAALEPRGEPRALIAERLSVLAERQGDGDTALEGRRAAWRASPSRARLLAMLDAADALDRVSETLSAEADALERGESAATPRLACELLLLSGRVAPAIALLEAAPPLGWSARDHPGPVVVPYLLVAAACGGAPEADSPLLAERFEDIDGGGGERRLTRLLTERLASAPRGDAERELWLTTASSVVERRTAAVVEAKHRGAYERVAGLVVACAEAVTLALGGPKGSAFVADIRGRYPRHHAFRNELDRATRRSPLLPPPLRRK